VTNVRVANDTHCFTSSAAVHRPDWSFLTRPFSSYVTTTASCDLTDCLFWINDKNGCYFTANLQSYT